KEEINNYLDDQLQLRLKSYTKVDLRACPHCGAQIPLISDECMYCGKPLEHIVGSTNTAFNITGSEADIIRSENQRVEQERHSIKNCPDCGAPFPLISNICESCGHVLHERDENSLNIKNLLNNIQRSIDRVTDAPKPKVYQIIGYWFYYIILILSIFAFIVGIIADSEAGKFISLTGFVASIIAMGTNAVLSDTKSPVLIADGEYYKARHSYEMYAREVDTLYGDDYEAQTLLSHFSTALKRLKRERYQNRIKVIRIILISALVIMGVITYFSTKDDNNTEPAPKNSEEITMPPNTEWMLNFSKELKPYPPESGIQDSLLSRFLRADNGTELSFVMSEFNKQPVFHWKVSQLELLPGDSTDYYRTFNYRKIGIQLLDSNYLHIPTLGECVVNPFLPQENYNTVIRSGKGHFYIDFWSKHSSSDERILYTISEKAVYYSIYSSNY
ncbi:MAG: zinc ribbon domain-containing protein, partial [Bacteroidales bacterium]|nr:zinc ribbon domain-containing protein [Bacteroidales bacterium]